METCSKRNRIQLAAMQLFQEQGVETTSVNDIVKKANVAKGTFYVYYKDKKELISQILTKKQGCLLNELLNVSYERSFKDGSNWLMAFLEETIAYYEEHPDVLRMIQKNIAVVMDTCEHRDLVLNEIERLDELLELLKKDKESKKQTLNRFLMILQMTGFSCFNAIFYELPDTLEQIKPILLETVEKLCK